MWVVISVYGCHCGEVYVEGVFTSEEKASAYAATRKDCHVEEIEVDPVV